MLWTSLRGACQKFLFVSVQHLCKAVVVLAFRNESPAQDHYGDPYAMF